MTDAMARIAAGAPRGWPSAPLIWDEVRTAYGSPGRAYHTLDHVAALVGWFEEVGRGPGWRHPCAVYLAILAHDAVYDVARTDNEARSAALARQWADRLGLPSATAERLILATAAHAGPPPGDDPDLLHFLDADLSILGANPELYDAYSSGVASEYAVVPPELYRMGRARFLADMAAKPTLFHTPWFRERLEAGARANLGREIAALAASSPAQGGVG